jgi:hypothetical protein
MFCMTEAKDGSPNELIKQLEGMGAYARRCGQGYKELGAYLSTLYTELDDVLAIPMDPKQAGEVRKAHSSYKANLKTANAAIAKHTKLEALVKKVLSGSIGTQEEAAQTISEIERSYQAVVGGALAVYQLIDPQIDASGLIGGLYSKLAEAKKRDINPKFAEGLELLRKYYVTDEMIAQIKSQAGKQRQQPAARAKAA